MGSFVNGNVNNERMDGGVEAALDALDSFAQKTGKKWRAPEQRSLLWF